MNVQRTTYLAASLLLIASAAGAQTPTAPPQPSSGPGGSDYLFTDVQAYGPYTSTGGSGITETYYIYQPSGPVPSSAPAVLFLHGYGADTPESYLLWIHHMVKMGYSVVWALYDQGAAATFVDHALYDWGQALSTIAKTPGMVPVAVDERGAALTGVVGHSAGAFTAFALAAQIDLPASILPPFRAIAAMEPGQGAIPTYSLSTVNPETGIVIVVGDKDKAKRRCQAAQIWEALPAAKGTSDRNFLEVTSDSYGTPQQLGNHYFPLTDTGLDTVPPPISVDDRDYNVSWKLSVAALNCMLKQSNCGIAFGNGDAQQITMGSWSDGTAVTPLLYVADPVTQFQGDCQDSDSVPDQLGMFE